MSTFHTHILPVQIWIIEVIKPVTEKILTKLIHEFIQMMFCIHLNKNLKSKITIKLNTYDLKCFPNLLGKWVSVYINIKPKSFTMKPVDVRFILVFIIKHKRWNTLIARCR